MSAPSLTLTPGQRLVVMSLLAALALALVGAGIAWNASQEALGREREQTVERAQVIAGAIDRGIADRLMLLRSIASLPVVRAGPVEEIEPLLSTLDPFALGFSAGIGWVDRDGFMRSLTGAPPGMQPVDLRERDYVQTVMATQTPTVGRAAMGRLDPTKPILVLAVPAYAPDGTFNGLLIGSMRLDRIESDVQAMGAPGVMVRVLDRAGQLIIDDGPVESLESFQTSSLWSTPQMLVEGVGLRGEPDRVIGIGQVPSAQWRLLVERPAAEVQGAAHRALQGQLLLLGLVALAGVGAAGWVGRALDDAQRSLQASERYYRELADSVPGTVFTLSRAGETTFMNRQGLEATGATAMTQLDGGWTASIHPDDLGHVQRTRAEAFAQVEPFELEYRSKDPSGGYRWRFAHIVPVQDERTGDPLRWIGTSLDMDDKKRAEEERERLLVATHTAELYFEALFNEVDDAILVFDATGQILDANRQAMGLLGASLDELRSMRFHEVMSGDGGVLRDEWEELVQRGRWHVETEMRRKDGSAVPVEARASAVPLSTGIVYVAIQRDITEWRELERAREEFLSMASHELKNPLAAITGHAQLLQRRETYNASSVASMLESVTRLERLVAELLEATHVANGQIVLQLAEVDLAQLASSAVERARASSSDHAIGFVTTARSLPCVCDAGRVAQVLDNLISNALKYTPPGSRIELGLEADATHAQLRVTDNGPGIPADLLPRLFDRYFRVDQAARIEGLGLGLFITRRIVDAHGGSIRVDSQLGQGTTFTMSLPGLVRRSEATIGSGARLLVVDDDPHILELVRATLADDGYQVSTASDGTEALRSMEHDRPEALLLDLTMPRMSGEALVAELDKRGLREGLPIALLSANHDVRATALRLGIAEVLEKPFDIDQLRTVVARLAQESRTSRQGETTNAVS